MVREVSRVAGAQSVGVCLDVRRNWRGKPIVCVRNGRKDTGRDPLELACELQELGAGEIILQSIDRDGTRRGFDCALTSAVSTAVPIPVIASGGAGTLEHFSEVFLDGKADAALAASIFHFSEHSVRALKQLLSDNGVPVRL